MIRPVTLADIPVVTKLIQNVLSEFGLVFGAGSATDEQVLALPASYETAGGKFWVAEHNREIVGTVGVYPLQPPMFELRKMYLLPAARGLGLGQKLLQVAEQFCVERGAQTLVLDTIHGMHSAIAFYERNGFVRDDSQIRGARCSRGYAKQLSAT